MRTARRLPFNPFQAPRAHPLHSRQAARRNDDGHGTAIGRLGLPPRRRPFLAPRLASPTNRNFQRRRSTCPSLVGVARKRAAIKKISRRGQLATCVGVECGRRHVRHGAPKAWSARIAASGLAATPTPRRIAYRIHCDTANFDGGCARDHRSLKSRCRHRTKRER